MHGAIARTPLLIAACTTGVAKSTSQVVKMMFAPCPSSLTAHAFAVVALLFCVSQVLITSLRWLTPPFLLIWAIRIFAAASAGSSNGAIWPARSNAHPITIGFFADVAAWPADPTRAAAATATPRSVAKTPHLILLLTKPSFWCYARSCSSRTYYDREGALVSHEASLALTSR